MAGRKEEKDTGAAAVGRREEKGREDQARVGGLYELDLWGGSSPGQDWSSWGSEWTGSDYGSGLRSLSMLAEKQSLPCVCCVPPVDELAPISASPSTSLSSTCVPPPVDELAPIRYKSDTAVSNRFSPLSQVSEEQPLRREDIGDTYSVPIGEFVREPSKRQQRRIKEHMKKKEREQARFGGCAPGCGCSTQHREEFPELGMMLHGPSTERQSSSRPDP